MNVPHSDALVFFGATGDLVYKKIFPALYAMERRGHLQVPVIGVARSDWTIEQFRARARESIERHGGFDEAVFAKFQERLHYISGDYGAPATHAAPGGSVTRCIRGPCGWRRSAASTAPCFRASA